MRVNGMRSLFSELFVVLSINLLGAVVASLNDKNRIATFIEKLAHCLSDFSEKLVFNKTYEKIGVAGSHFGTHGYAISLFVVVSTNE